jgi:hypothetical protein
MRPAPRHHTVASVTAADRVRRDRPERIARPARPGGRRGAKRAALDDGEESSQQLG